ncbi:copper resistance protein B [Hyphomonas chukchiensis]|uniref:copper resistance protein B n=1 Tax=Hyphomonas chukchiensis TaxID=1280947 RepID=UPI0030F77360
MIRAAAFLALAVSFVAPVQAEETALPWSMADQYFDAGEMAAARHHIFSHHGATRQLSIMADRLEVQSADEGDTLVWDGNAWYGGDVNKLWLKSEGDYPLESDELEEAEVQALWSHAISPYFDLQGGVRYDLEPKGRTHAVLGLQGLAPYWFEVDAAAFLSSEGDLTARMEAEYEFRLTQRLILQPRVEAELSAQDIPDLEIGSGLTSLNAGLRLRYEMVREFAPYIGVEWQGSFGGTADYFEAAGEDSDRAVFVAGIRAWF